MNVAELDLAVKTFNGSGAQVFGSFEDPNRSCGKRVHQELRGVTDFNLCTFLVPLRGQESGRQIQAISCAAGLQRPLAQR